MVKPDVIVDKWSGVKFCIAFNYKECDQAFKDHSIGDMGGSKEKVVQADGNDDGDGSHVQEEFGW